MPTTTVNGLPSPDAGDANNVPGDIAALVAVLDAGSVVKRLSQAQIDALTSGQKPAGLVVFNATSDCLQMSTGSGWATIPKASSATPAAVTTGTPTAGTALLASREDHSHALPAHDHSTTAKGGAIPQASITGLGVWADYVPVLSQGASENIAKTVHFARWVQVGDLVVCMGFIQALGTGTAGERVQVTLPATAAALGAGDFIIGTGDCYVSGTGHFAAIVHTYGTTKMRFRKADSSFDDFGQTPSHAIAESDQIRWHIAYEVA